MIWIHRKVPDAEYRVRKMRGKDLYSVTEYYKDERVQLCDNELSYTDACELARSLAQRDEF